MEEIKEILLNIQSTQEKLQAGQEKLQEGLQTTRAELQEGLQTTRAELEEELQITRAELQEGLQTIGTELEEKLQIVKQQLNEEIRAVNGRLAAFQVEILQKVQTLFDADSARKEHLEDYDERIQNISSQLFEHSVRISNLETKFRGA